MFKEYFNVTYFLKYYIPNISINTFWAYLILKVKESQNLYAQIETIISDFGYNLSEMWVKLITQVVALSITSLVVFFLKNATKKVKFKESEPKYGKIKIFILMSILSFVATFPMKHLLNFFGASTKLDSVTGIMLLFVIPFMVCPVLLKFKKLDK